MVLYGQAEVLEQAHFIDCTGIVVFIDVLQFKHGSSVSYAASLEQDKELQAIFERTYGKVKDCI